MMVTWIYGEIPAKCFGAGTFARNCMEKYDMKNQGVNISEIMRCCHAAVWLNVAGAHQEASFHFIRIALGSVVGCADTVMPEFVKTASYAVIYEKLGPPLLPPTTDAPSSWCLSWID